MSFVTALSERKKIDTYVETDCLVKNSSLEKCGVVQTDTGDEQCYRLSWRIEYIQYRNNKQTTITRSELYPKSETHREDELKVQLKRHQIDKIYRCYHSPTDRLKKVQWQKPSIKIYTKFMIYGMVSLLFLIILLVVPINLVVGDLRSYYMSRRQYRRYFAASRTRAVRVQNIPLISSLPSSLPTAPRREYHVVLNSPPPVYTSQTTSVEDGEHVPVTPPPPYVTPSVSIENENIPLTPPPPYEPSPV